MDLLQKCQYALRSLFELAHRPGQGSVNVAEIAKARVISRRFLELILNELKHAELVAQQNGRDAPQVADYCIQVAASGSVPVSGQIDTWRT